MNSKLVLAVVATFAALTVVAQAPGIKRTVLQKGEAAAADRDVILARAELAAGGSTGRHTHPGPEIGYVLEGSPVLEIDGQPPRELKPGDSYVIPAGTVHNAKVVGDKTGVVLATYVVEKGKPLATPAPN
jgi:quercetin dioxygenase-like cupin family protein